MKLDSLFTAVVLLGSIAAPGCSDKSDRSPAVTAAPAPAAPAPAPAASTPSAPAPAAPAAAPASPPSDTVPADFPTECVAYAALIDKLKACDKLGSARDGLMQGYNGLRASWSAVPADQRASIAGQCKTQADSLRSAAAATCGW